MKKKLIIINAVIGAIVFLLQIPSYNRWSNGSMDGQKWWFYAISIPLGMLISFVIWPLHIVGMILEKSGKLKEMLEE